MDAANSTNVTMIGPQPLLALPVLVSLCWAIYELFYSSRVLAFLVTRLVNLFLTDHGIEIKSLSFNLLNGRLLFKQVHYYTRDYTIRVSDGYLSLRWWGSCGKDVCRRCKSDCSHQPRRAPSIHLELNGFEYHWYNRSDVYDHWGVEEEETGAEDLDSQEDSTFWRWWKSNQPSIHLSIRRGRVLLGNHLVERSLVFYFSRAEVHYSTSGASNPFDELMHVVNFDAVDPKVVLECSRGYTGPVSEERPPVLCEGMEDAYLLFKADSAYIQYLQDSPGIVPLGENNPPKYAFDVKLGTNSVINYSCYGNRQRYQFQKIFFPNDHTERPFTNLPEPGQRRIYTMFDISVELTSPATLYQLFSDRKGNLAHLAVEVGPGSTVSIHQPWVYSEDGQISVVKGNLKNVKVTSSLDYQLLGSAEDFQFQTELHFPCLWNAVQTWDMRFSGDTVQANILFAYIDFFNDLLDDWVGSDPSDLLTFVPIDWRISIDLTHYEIFLFTNRNNWLDTSMNGTENTRIAFCGASGQLTFKFPFTEFNPQQQKVHFKAEGKDLVVRRYVPPSCTTKKSLFALSSTNKHRWRTMKIAKEEGEVCGPISSNRPSRATAFIIDKDSGKDVSTLKTTPKHAGLNRTTSHIITAPIMGSKNTPPKPHLSPLLTPRNVHQPPVTDHLVSGLNSPPKPSLPDREEMPMGYRGVTKYKDGWLDFASGPLFSIVIDYTSHAHNIKAGEFTKLHPNVLDIDIDAPVVMFRVFGFLARDLLALKENYPGPNINFKTFNSNIPTPQTVPERPAPPHLESAPPPNPPDGSHEPAERTMHLFVDFKLRNITAEFPTHLPEGYPRDFPLPSLCTDQLRVYVEYTNRDTMVRLSVSPLSVHVPTQVPSSLKRSPDHSGCGDVGHVVVSGVSLHCHGFTELLCKERVEYAWLMKFSISRITGALSTQQLVSALDWFSTGFVHTASFGDGSREAPDAELIIPLIEPISEDIKYSLLDVVIEEGDLSLMDGNFLTRIQTPGFDLGFCNLHSNAETLGLSFQVQGANLTVFSPLKSNENCLVECGSLDIGNIQGDLNLREVMDCVPERQLAFLKLADHQTRRLWFLWREESGCGCRGECLFLDGRIARPSSRGKVQSEVYRADANPKCIASLESLKKSVESGSIRNVDSLWALHRSLLQHYQDKYRAPDALERVLSAASLSNTTDDSFVSARTSLSSIHIQQEDFLSTNDISTASASGRGQHKKKPSNLSSATMKEGAPDEGCDLDTYKDVVATAMVNDVVIHIPVSQPDSDTDNLPSVHREVRKTLSEGAVLQNPLTPPTTVTDDQYLNLRLPLMTSLTGSQIPEVVSRKSPHSEEIHKTPSSCLAREEKEGLADVSLSVCVNGCVKFVATPPVLNMVEMVTRSVHEFFSHRSHVAILNTLSHFTLSSIRDHLAHLKKDNTPQSTPRHPLLYLSVSMADQSFAAVQLLQSPKEITALPNKISDLFGLKEIVRHMSLLTAFLSGASCYALIQTSKEVQRSHTQRTGGAVSKTILCSVDVLVDVHVPALQMAVGALVPTEHVSEMELSLSGLPRQQSQLNFTLESGSDLVVCNLLEAGLKQVGLSVVAKILSSEFHEEMVLDWSHIHSYHDNNVQLNSPSEEIETRSNHFVVQMSCPLFWSQVSSPHTGIAGPSTGGLDLLVLHEAVRAWQSGLERLASVVSEVLKNKRLRDKRVLLTLVANAARNSMICKQSFNPVHSDVTLSLRHSVAYSCLHQLWETVAAFTETAVPVDEGTHTYDKELVCSLLGISMRLYSKHDEVEIGEIKNYTCLSCGPMSPSLDALCDTQSVGYVSISPSPSELAIPNVLVSDIDLKDIDYDPFFSKTSFTLLLALRESLLPFYKEAGMKIEPQLRTVYHNSDVYLGDFSLNVRETNMFVTECVEGQRCEHPPVVLVRKLTVIGSLKYTRETTPTQTPPLLSLLPRNQSGDDLVSKVNMSSSCSVIVDSLATSLTIPLLKLGRHMLETGRFRAYWIRQAKIYSDEQLNTPRPSLDNPQVIIETTSPPAEVVRSEVIRFTQMLVSLIRSIEETIDDRTVGVVSENTRSTPKASGIPSPQFDETMLTGSTGMKAPPELASSVTSGEVAILMNDDPPHLWSPNVDTLYDTTGEQHTVSSDELSPRPGQSRVLDAPVGPGQSSVLDASVGPGQSRVLDASVRPGQSSVLDASVRPGQSSVLDTSVGPGQSSVLDTSVGPGQSRVLDTSVGPGQSRVLDTSVGPGQSRVLDASVGPGQSRVLDASVGPGQSRVLDASVGPGQSSVLDASVVSPMSDSSRLGTFLIKDHSPPVVRTLSLSMSELVFSLFGLLKIRHIECSVQIETTRAKVEFEGISGSVDTRKASPRPLLPKRAGNETPLLKDMLPTYLSVTATLQRSQLTVHDWGLPENEMLTFKAQPVYASVGVSNTADQRVPTYRCLLKLSGVKLTVKQSPVIVHKRYQTLMPVFSAIYKDVFASSVAMELGADMFPSATPTPPVVNIAEVKLPSRLPQGLIHFSLDETTITLSPLPSLTVMYVVSPVCAEIETTSLIKFQLSIGHHIVKFSPKNQFKDDLTLRSLPTLNLKGTVQGSGHTPRGSGHTPRVNLELSVKHVVIDITTDVLNQLLILQNSFIKEVNDLIQLFSSLGESIPAQSKPKPLPPQSDNSDNGLVLLSFLDSCRLSLSGICVTISTPLSTAIRFSTGKIDMHLINASANDSSSTLQSNPLNRSRFDVVGRVEIDIYAGLGVLQDSDQDTVDDLWEMAYFKTRISLRNKVQNLSGPGDGAEPPVVVDTFSISILSPHLYLQSTAFEQGILFWLNCKSVYNYWQNERKLLNAEVQAATEAIIEKIQHRPNQLQTPSIDFSKPRLVQLTVSDVGACMPLTPLTSGPHHRQSQPFPALVVTIKEMQFRVNFSHKIASTGNFETFCVRFAEQFIVRQKTWTLDPKKHKFNNHGSINHGTFRLCVATQHRYSDINLKVSAGEKLIWAFQWDMSGIDVNANTDIGRHTSSIIRTITTIGSDLDGSKTDKVQSSAGMGTHRPSRRNQSASHTPHRHGRSVSVAHHTHLDEAHTTNLEQELAKQTRKLHSLKTSGVSADVVLREEDTLRLLQQELARAMHSIFKHPSKASGRWSQLLSPHNPEIKGVHVEGLATPIHSGSEVHRRRTKSLSFGPTLTAHSSTSSRSTTPLPNEDEPLVTPDVDEHKEEEGFTLPSIDVDLNVTINVDYGKIVLRMDESPMERNLSFPLLSQSPSVKSKMKPAEPYGSMTITETVIHVPALTVKAHYQSIVGTSYSNPPVPRSQLHNRTSETHSVFLSPLAYFTTENKSYIILPVKKGVLSISAVIASLPEPITLTPSLLEFVEKVAKPTIAATVMSSSSSTESDSEETGREVQAPTVDSWPISFPVDVTLAFQIQPSTMQLTCQPHSRVVCVIQSPDVNFVISFSLFTHHLVESDSKTSSPLGSGNHDNQTKSIMFNNLYITGCLTTFALQLFSPPITASKQTAAERKEAFSLTLGQALVHFSRKSVLSPSLGSKGSTAQSVDDYVPNSKLQVSVILDIASVVFGYDMRRLNDVTAFRRYWYRTSLVEALFIGTKDKPEEGVTTPGTSATPKEDTPTEPSGVVRADDAISAAIVVAANVEDLRMSANFAQVMGNADLLVTQFRCEAHCDVQHNELVLLEMDGKLMKGELDARGGVIAGSILMEGAQTHVTTYSFSGYVPVHRCTAVVQLVEGRVDYMSSCSFLTRATELHVLLRDSWEGLKLEKSGEVPKLASVNIVAEFTWDKLQLAIHRSTTKSMFNMVQKMYEFVMQQKRRSERTISLMLPSGSAASKALHAYRQEQKRSAEKEEAKNKGYMRHHWLWAMRVGSMELMRTLGLHTPLGGHQVVSLGAKIKVSGENVCIVCFHGPSFRETEWAVFNVDTVQASFSTQAIPGLGSAQLTELTEQGTDALPMKQVRTCQQIVQLSIGHTPWEESQKLDELASIYRVSAGRTPPPSIVGSSIDNWLGYACIQYHLHRDKYSHDSSTLVRLSKRLSVQPVLLVPAFTVELVNDHFWPQDAGMSEEEFTLSPLVECGLMSSFAQGISVTTHVDHYLFLHDLVKAYIDYLEKHKAPHLTADSSFPEATTPPTPSPSSPSSVPKDISSPPGRTFECVCWELDPHLCLLSSAGSGQFNPHISWLLEKLGLQHARTTIPKWIQRVAMDPLDMVVANVVELLIKVTATKKLKLVASSPPSEPR